MHTLTYIHTCKCTWICTHISPCIQIRICMYVGMWHIDIALCFSLPLSFPPPPTPSLLPPSQHHILVLWPHMACSRGSSGCARFHIQSSSTHENQGCLDEDVLGVRILLFGVTPALYLNCLLLQPLCRVGKVRSNQYPLRLLLAMYLYNIIFLFKSLPQSEEDHMSQYPFLLLREISSSLDPKP